MTLVLTFHNVTSLLLALLCWWLAHEEARRQPPGRVVAIGAAIVGFIVLVTAIGRSTGLAPVTIDVMLITLKMGLILTIGGIVVRHYRRRRRKGSAQIRSTTLDPDADWDPSPEDPA